MIKFKKAAVYLCCGAMIASLAGCGAKTNTTKQPTTIVENSEESTENASAYASEALTDTESEAELTVTGPKKITGLSKLGNIAIIEFDDRTSYVVGRNLYDELKAKGEESSDTEYMITSRKMTDAEMEAYKEEAAATGTMIIGSLALYSACQGELENLTDEKIHEAAISSIHSGEQDNTDAIAYGENAIRLMADIKKFADDPDVTDEEFNEAMKNSKYYDACIEYAKGQLQDTGITETIVSYEISE